MGIKYNWIYPTYDEATNTIREMTRDELIELIKKGIDEQ